MDIKKLLLCIFSKAYKIEQISAVYLIGKAEICQDPPTWSQDDQTLSQHKEVKNWRHEEGGVQLEKHADIFYGWKFVPSILLTSLMDGSTR